MKPSKKTLDRIETALPKFQKILGVAKARDLNESDTVSIITDILADIFGYEKYVEITSELAIRGTYCDLAVKCGDKIQYLIECKAIGTELKEAHLRQAVGYGANKGIQWVILTNSVDWQIYRIRFEQPLAWDQVARFDLTSGSAKDDKLIAMLCLIAKEGVEKGARDDLYEKIQCVNRFVIGAILQSEPVVTIVRRELRRIADGIRIDDAEVQTIIRESVLRRDLIEGDEAVFASAKIAKMLKAVAGEKRQDQPRQKTTPTNLDCAPVSLADSLLAEATAAEQTSGEPEQTNPTESSMVSATDRV